MIKDYEILGFKIVVNEGIGHLTVTHDGNLTWDELFQIKNVIWGEETRAIEVFPAKSMLVNSGSHRHLWRLGAHDFCPDLLGADLQLDSLEARHARAWAEARNTSLSANEVSELDVVS